MTFDLNYFLQYPVIFIVLGVSYYLLQRQNKLQDELLIISKASVEAINNNTNALNNIAYNYNRLNDTVEKLEKNQIKN